MEVPWQRQRWEALRVYGSLGQLSRCVRASAALTRQLFLAEYAKPADDHGFAGDQLP